MPRRPGGKSPPARCGRSGPPRRRRSGRRTPTLGCTSTEAWDLAGIRLARHRARLARPLRSCRAGEGPASAPGPLDDRWDGGFSSYSPSHAAATCGVKISRFWSHQQATEESGAARTWSRQFLAHEAVSAWEYLALVEPVSPIAQRVPVSAATCSIGATIFAIVSGPFSPAGPFRYTSQPVKSTYSSPGYQARQSRRKGVAGCSASGSWWGAFRAGASSRRARATGPGSWPVRWRW